MLAERDGIAALPGYQALFSLEPNYRKQHRFSSHLRLDADHLHRVNDLVDAMIREIGVHAPGYRFLVTGLFMQLVVTLSRLFSDTLHPPVVALLELERLLNDLAARLDEEVSLGELARRAGMSPSTLLRRFRTATGYAPMEYLIRLRLDRARELLATTNRRITEVAFETGFRDSNYFARRFRQHTGVSPRQYRKTVRQRG
jgi:AraC-like DNA-binding protein